MSTERKIILYGRLFLTGEIQAETGLHVGAGSAAIAIGGLDNPVIRDPLTDRPYIPGSSLKGKMRSLREKADGRVQNKPIGQVFIHTCKEKEAYSECDVCHIFGVPGEESFAQPTRLFVRDIRLTDESAGELERVKMDLPYTEVKWEVAIDRITSAANPRQMERVPAGAIFGPMEMVYSIYEALDIERFTKVIEAMQLVEDDYLGGLGSRGSGKVRFQALKLTCKAKGTYDQPQDYNVTFGSVQEMLGKMEEIKKWLKEKVPIEQAQG